MPSSSNLNFNDLPDDVQSLFFRILDPSERALISLTFQDWHHLIMGTQDWWRSLMVPHDFSRERLVKMLKFFTEKSQNTMRSVVINRLIEEKEELEEIFDIISISSSTIKILCIREAEGTLNSQTRHFSRSLPQLQFLLSTKSDLQALQSLKSPKLDYPDELENRLPKSFDGLRYFNTGELDALSHEDIKWLGKLRSLRAHVAESIETIYSVLNSSRSTLETFSLAKLRLQPPGRGTERKAIIMERLSDLRLPVYPLDRPALSMSLVAPNLKSLSARLSQIQDLNAPHLLALNILLGREEAGEWNAQRFDQFCQDFASVLLNKASIQRLQLIGCSSDRGLQTMLSIHELFSFGSENEIVLLPNLVAFSLRKAKVVEIDDLVLMYFERQRHRHWTSGSRDFSLQIPSDIHKQFLEIVGGTQEAVTIL